MENILYPIKDTFLAIVQVASSYSMSALAKLPQETILFGLILGFFSMLKINGSNYLHIKNIVNDLCYASKRLSIIATIAMTGYIYYYLSIPEMLYYIVAAILGLFLCLAFIALLDLLGVIGQLIGIILSAVSGPIVIILCWFFHTGEFMDFIKGLF